MAWWISVSDTRDPQESPDKYAAAVRPINELLIESFAEVQEQGIMCGDAVTRPFGPLQFTQRLLSQSVYPCKS